MVRGALRALLDDRDDLEVVAEASDLAGARDAVASAAPDVLVLDVNLPDGLGVDAVAGLREAHPGTQIVLLTMERDIGLARRALDDGALGYLFKDAAHLELVEAVRAAAARRALRDARGRRRPLPRPGRAPPTRRSPHGRPTCCG